MLYTEKAMRDFARLDDQIAKRLIKKLDYFIKTKDPLKYATKLKNIKIETFRFRIGNYRVIFRIDKKTNKLVILVILRVEHRNTVYNH